MEQTTAKSFEQQLKEEQEKLIAEIKEKVRRKRTMMKSEPETRFQTSTFKRV